ncbi:hypothetical protein SERLA73DRAFT_152226 [Serpula lacrymans var. lacrymans S7.3]|uniref:Uncharacterized protein n=1 Tax=Serpula lacrymans var. lacrymans (strain S7.3) TaxID=936435 RepID=F8PVC4_SERL3|nr:hypothetical protein SERLA73DRAFT_152226 [Serpula lacrymans var. lacrymans S7.3]
MKMHRMKADLLIHLIPKTTNYPLFNNLQLFQLNINNVEGRDKEERDDEAMRDLAQNVAMVACMAYQRLGIAPSQPAHWVGTGSRHLANQLQAPVKPGNTNNALFRIVPHREDTVPEHA